MTQLNSEAWRARLRGGQTPGRKPRDKPAGGRSVKNLDGAARKNSPEDGSKSNPTSSLRIPQAWAPHPRWEASLPAGHNIQEANRHGTRGGLSARSARAPGALPPAESSPTSEGARAKAKRKDADGGHRPSSDTHRLLAFLQGEEIHLSVRVLACSS